MQQSIVKRTTKADLPQAMRDLEARGYECIHPMRVRPMQHSHVRYEKQNGHADRIITTNDEQYYVTMRREEG